MSIESAKTYIERMRGDQVFRHAVNALAEDEEASWQFIRENGYVFSMTEFQQARDLIYAEYGITPL